MLNIYLHHLASGCSFRLGARNSGKRSGGFARSLDRCKAKIGNNSTNTTTNTNTNTNTIEMGVEERKGKERKGRGKWEIGRGSGKSARKGKRGAGASVANIFGDEMRWEWEVKTEIGIEMENAIFACV